ncbi:MAG: CPBP family intramembrane glutamic endopeptidase [Thermoguttaceae bacterium]
MAEPPKHAPLGQLAERYWVESRRPLASLVFVAPLLVLYEVGVLALGVRQNGADAALQHLLEMLGFSQHVLPAFLLICILLGWHYLAHEPWQLSGGILSGMAAESLLLGLVLRVLSFVQNAMMSLGATLKASLGFLGAGIYEELVFRLILLSILVWAFRHAKFTPRMSVVAAVALSSLLFAAAHNVGPYGETLAWSRFLFRTLAGVFFAVVFWYRGFGIAAGCHAAYDIFVCLFHD